MPESGYGTEVLDDLVALRDHAKSTQMLAGFLTFATLVAAIVLGYSLLAGANVLLVLRAPAARWAGLVALVASGGAAFGAYVLRPLLWNPTFDCLARMAEEKIDGIDNAYINAVQLSRERRIESPYLLTSALAECRARVRRFDVLEAVDRRTFRRRAWAAAAVGACLLTYMTAAPSNFAAGLMMLLNPMRFVPSVGAAEIASVMPGDTSVVRGQEVKIEAAIKRALKAIPSASVRVTESGGAKTEKELLPVSATEFRASLGTAEVPFDYLVEIGGTESRWYHVDVSEKPAVRAMNILYEYPEYTGLGHKVARDSAGDISGPVGTRVTLEVVATRPLASAYVDFGAEKLDMLPGADEYRREGAFVLKADGLYRTFLTDTSGNSSGASVSHPIKAVRDQAPAVSIPVPGRDTTAAAGSKVNIAIDASDDYGLGAVELVVADADTQRETVAARWENVAVKSTTLATAIVLDPKAYAAGKTYVYYARARDNNALGGPQEGRSPRYSLKVVDPEAARAELIKALESLYDRLKAVLEAQRAARQDAGAVDMKASDAGAKIAGIRKAQEGISEKTLGVAGDVPEADALGGLRRVLEGLVAGDMAAAIDECDGAAKKLAAGKAADLAALTAAQDRIIATLTRILNVVAALIEDAKAGKLDEANEIPADVQDELRKLLDDLRKFVEDQKRVIEATNNLAARPVDDYTDADKQRLKDLAASESDWSKFLKEAYSDLSKLPKQDFSDPTMLKDLVETYSEIEMAADALTKEVAVMSVPHEQAGLELAEELTTHIEKWLPDTPDRWKWEMEEPLTQTDVPTAELPAELQDIVGDLMAEEEDLFSDVEDVSSSWADSIDKGAGWDALDGPISNMSAQGVTGNALPNASEIGGRSGEGRTGRSSGEFVGDTTVGKGGRRTPTRITPDDFLGGQVQDKSAQAAGGATGGGKEAGAGERGLAGPVPRQLAQRIAALAGRQAEITSSAQKVNIAMNLGGYPRADMEAALQSMKSTEEALRAGRFGNAIRERAILARSLKGVRSIVGRDIVVRKDNSLVLPRGLQEEIIDGARGRAPRGYEKLLKGYYESLSVTK